MVTRSSEGQMEDINAIFAKAQSYALETRESDSKKDIFHESPLTKPAQLDKSNEYQNLIKQAKLRNQEE